MVEATQSGGGGSEQEAHATLGIGRVIADKYEIEALLGAGGMGAVYVARHKRTRKTWALKVLHPEMSARPVVVQRFLAEAQAAGVIGHPGIVEIIDQDRDGDLYFLVMPKLEGEELSARIARARPLAVKFVARVGADIADAIHAAHRAKIIHRDLKPPNVFLANRGGHIDVVQLLDFGIAKLIDEDGTVSGLTRTSDIYGTPHYMSPEQLKSAKDVDERTDIYAIGVILYEALTGHRPYDADNMPDLIVRIMTEEPPPLEKLRPDVPPALAAIVRKAMAHDRAARFPTAAALRDALRVHAGTLAEPSDPLAATIQTDTGQFAPAPRADRRPKLLKWGAAAVVVAALLAGGGLAVRHRTPASPAPPPKSDPAPQVKIAPTPPPRPAPPAPDRGAAPPNQPPSTDDATKARTTASTPTKKKHRKTDDGADDLPPLRPQ